MDIVRNYQIAKLALECTGLIPRVTQLIKGILVALSVDFNILHYYADRYSAFGDIAGIEKYLWRSDSAAIITIMERCTPIMIVPRLLNHVRSILVHELSFPCRELVRTGDTDRYSRAALVMGINKRREIQALQRYLCHSQDPEVRGKVEVAINYVRGM